MSAVARDISAIDVVKLIYFGIIASDRLLGVLPFGGDWLKATSKMGTVNLRIYADYESLRAARRL